MDSDFIERLRVVLHDKRLTQKKLSDLTQIDQRTISRWKHIDNPPSEGSVLKICHVTGCSFDWLMHGQGEMFPPKAEKAEDTIHETQLDLSHEKEKFSLPEMVTMTMAILESDTVYRSALASNIRAFYKGVISEKEMKSVKDDMEEMKDEIRQLKELLLSLGATLPEKRDKAANS